MPDAVSRPAAVERLAGRPHTVRCDYSPDILNLVRIKLHAADPATINVKTPSGAANLAGLSVPGREGLFGPFRWREGGEFVMWPRRRAQASAFASGIPKSTGRSAGWWTHALIPVPQPDELHRAAGSGAGGPAVLFRLVAFGGERHQLSAAPAAAEALAHRWRVKLRFPRRPRAYGHDHPGYCGGCYVRGGDYGGQTGRHETIRPSPPQHNDNPFRLRPGRLGPLALAI